MKIIIPIIYKGYENMLIIILLMCYFTGYLLFLHLNNPNCLHVSNIINNKIEIKKVPIINQFPSLPTGCEATSTAMLLQWAGINVSKEEIAKSLPNGKNPYWHNGKFIGGNPYYEFVGNPFSKSGFGVFHKPIKDIINRYLPGKAQDISGCSFEKLLKIIDSGRPVIVWVTINMRPPKVNSIWYDKKGNKVVWKTPEHALILIGYTNSHVIVNDPLIGKKEYYNRSIFKNRWVYMGKQAVTIKH